MDEIVDEYQKARKCHDYEKIEALINGGLSIDVREEAKSFGLLHTAYDLAEENDNYVLVDALLSRTDIREEVMQALVFRGSDSLKMLKYLESKGTNIGKICFESEDDIFIHMLKVSSFSDYDREQNGQEWFDKKCKEFCEIIDFLKSRGVDTYYGYLELVDSADRDYPWFKIVEPVYDEVAKRLKPKGGKKWKARG